MKIQSLRLRPTFLLLILIVSSIALSGCDMKAFLASQAGDTTIKVVNHISPEHELHVRAGFASTKKIQYQEDRTFWIPLDEGNRRASTDLSVMIVEKATNITVASHKERITFQPRDIGPAIIQISDLDLRRFDIE